MFLIQIVLMGYILCAGATLVMSLIGLRSRKFRTWMAIPIALIYPLSVFIVWFLDYVVHLDDVSAH